MLIFKIRSCDLICIRSLGYRQCPNKYPLAGLPARSGPNIGLDIGLAHWKYRGYGLHATSPLVKTRIWQAALLLANITT